MSKRYAVRFYVGISDTPPPQDDESPEEGEGGQDEADADAAAAEEVSDAHMTIDMMDELFRLRRVYSFLSRM